MHLLRGGGGAHTGPGRNARRPYQSWQACARAGQVRSKMASLETFFWEGSIGGFGRVLCDSSMLASVWGGTTN